MGRPSSGRASVHHRSFLQAKPDTSGLTRNVTARRLEEIVAETLAEPEETKA
jgi:hypothetical protein